MAIVSDSSGITITGKEDISKYRLIVMKGALKLEKLGMKHSRGSVRALVKKMNRCPKTNDYDRLISFLEERISE